jgi:pyruvate/2-oxoglutarate dehydrogenase complex dihydrolipoamide dehydrogenase (E3) component
VSTQNLQENIEQFDAIVIGAGQAGGPLSTALANAGHRTALIERAYVGGTCINYGCTPTKTMVASARVAYLARRSADYGVQTGQVSVEMKVVRERKRRIVEEFRNGSRSSIEAVEGVELIEGEASFTGAHTVAVSLRNGEKRRLSARWIFINVGASPAIPPIDGLAEVDFLNSTTVMELAHVPDHLLVLGGGYIGVEFGQMFRRFGSEVTIVQRGKQLLTREDEDVADCVAEILREDGVTLLLESDAVSVHQDGEGIHLRLRTPEGERTITGSHLLLAAGRTPNTAVLDLKAAGIEMDKRGQIPVNNRLQTNVPGIYALGDVKGGPAFTHISYDDFRIVRDNLLEGKDSTTDNRHVPYCVFMDPELGRVGLSESEARSQGYQVKVAKIPMSSVARALEMDEPRGLMKAVVDVNTSQILGFAMVGIWGGEIMSLIQVAMMGQLPYTALAGGIFAHPTLAESLNNLFGGLDEV